MSIVTVALVGGVVGLHSATWGAYKDSPFEGFRWLSWARSVFLAIALGFGVRAVTPPGADVHLLVVAFVVYAVERLATEGWKAILRENDQDAFTIPMRLGFRGRPVDHRGVRYAAGGLLLAALVGGGVGAHAMGAAVLLPRWALVVLVGGLAGWATAIGGAWKDAPIEGFSGWKFLRSPAVATASAVPLSALTEDWALLALSAGGVAVAVIETYKTFFTGDRPPGKFHGRAVVSCPPWVRSVTGCTHAGTWLVLAGVLLASGARSAGVEQAREPSAVWDILPWFGTGTLSLAVAAGVLRHTGTHWWQAQPARGRTRPRVRWVLRLSAWVRGGAGRALGLHVVQVLAGMALLGAMVAWLAACGSVAGSGSPMVDHGQGAARAAAGLTVYFLGTRQPVTTSTTSSPAVATRP